MNNIIAQLKAQNVDFAWYRSFKSIECFYFVIFIVFSQAAAYLIRDVNVVIVTATEPNPGKKNLLNSKMNWLSC